MSLGVLKSHSPSAAARHPFTPAPSATFLAIVFDHPQLRLNWQFCLAPLREVADVCMFTSLPPWGAQFGLPTGSCVARALVCADVRASPSFPCVCVFALVVPFSSSCRVHWTSFFFLLPSPSEGEGGLSVCLRFSLCLFSGCSSDTFISRPLCFASCSCVLPKRVCANIYRNGFDDAADPPS